MDETEGIECHAWGIQTGPFVVFDRIMFRQKFWPYNLLHIQQKQFILQKVVKISEQNGLKGLQVVQFECPRHWNPSVLSILEVARISLFPLLALWGNKNGLPSMKVKKLKNFQNKYHLTGCKWFSLNAPGTETLVSCVSIHFSFHIKSTGGRPRETPLSRRRQKMRHAEVCGVR